MFNVCAGCGVYRADKSVEDDGWAVCPECGWRTPFKQHRLLLVGGASGTGKTTVCQALTGSIEGAVVLDADVLWSPAFDEPNGGYRVWFETWLRLCKNIGQSGRPVVLFGAGMVVPGNMEPCVERRYFSTLHYLALVCDESVLGSRLRARPAWRNCTAPNFIDEQIAFDHWLREQGPCAIPPIALVETGGATVADTVAEVRVWIEQGLRDGA